MKVEQEQVGKRFEGESLARWNRRLNRRHSQEDLLRGSLLVRAAERRRRAVLRRLVDRSRQGKPDPIVVDVGCGSSLFHHCLPAGARLIRVDIDDEVLRGLPAHPGVAQVASDGARLPLPDGSVDLVVLSAILEHAPDPDALLGEVHRVLRRGGSLVVCVPYDRAVLLAKRIIAFCGVARFFRGIHPGLAPGHLHVFSARRLRARLGSLGRPIFFLDPISLCLYARLDVDRTGA